MTGFSFDLLSGLSLGEKDRVEAESGFGCVRCGVTIYHYCVARWGEVERRFLLCPACYAKVAEGAINAVQLDRLTDDPIALLPHFRRDHLPFSSTLPRLSIAGRSDLAGISAPLMLGWIAPIRFFPPARGNGATFLSISMGDADGQPVALVERNEWVADPKHWHFIARGERYHFTATVGEDRLVLRWLARDQVAVEQLLTRLNGRNVEVTQSVALLDGQPVRADFHENRMVGLQIEAG